MKFIKKASLVILIFLVSAVAFGKIAGGSIYYYDSESNNIYHLWKVPIISHFTFNNLDINDVEIKCGYEDYSIIANNGMLDPLYTTPWNAFTCLYLKPGFKTKSEQFQITNNDGTYEINGNTYLNIKASLERDTNYPTHTIKINTNADSLEVSGLGAKSCGNKECVVYENEAFEITAKKDGYITKTYTSSGISSDKSITINLDPSLKIILDPSPIRGIISWGDEHINIADNYNSNGIYYIPLESGTHTISYTDNTGRYESFSDDIDVNSNSQTIIKKDISETKYNLGLDIVDSVNNSYVNANVIAIYDEKEHSCQLNGDEYDCEIPHATDFSIKVLADGYLDTEQQFPQLTENPQPGTSISLERLLNIHIESPVGAVNSGELIINNSDNTEVLASINLDENTATDFSFAISPQQVNVYFIGGENFSNVSQTIELSSDSQSLVELNPLKIWHTDVNVISPFGNVDDYTLSTDSGECYDTYCILYPDATKISVEKAGYVKKDYDIPQNNNGSPLNIHINTTLAVNVSDINDLPADGFVNILDNNNIVAQGAIVNGVALVPLNPDLNNGNLIIRLFSDNFITNTTDLNNNIDDLHTEWIQLKTLPMTKLTLLISNYYTNLPLDDYNVLFKSGDTDYCSSNPCKFDMLNPPEKVNISLSKDGYFSKELYDVDTGSGQVEVKLKPRVVAYFDRKVNVSVINADDGTKHNVESLDNGITSIPIEENTKFLLNATAENYRPLLLGPYNSSTDNKIGSYELPLKLTPLHIISKEYGPLITNFKYKLVNENVSFFINASDEGRGEDIIDYCYLMVDNNDYWHLMDSSYDNYIVNASLNLSLENGLHNVSVYCSDVNNGDGPQKDEKIIINRENNEEPNEEKPNEEPQEKVVPLSLKLAELKEKYNFIVKAGLNTPELSKSMSEVENKINTEEADTLINNLEKELPLVELNGGGNVRTYKQKEPEKIAYSIAMRENQPYTKSELKSIIKTPIFHKNVEKYILNGNPKSVITLKIMSDKEDPDAVVADFNSGVSHAKHTILMKDGSISYFKGLHKGENVFEYVVDGDIEESPEPIIFDMKTLNGASRTLKQITGFAVGFPGFEIPVIYLGIGVGVLLLIIKFLL